MNPEISLQAPASIPSSSLTLLGTWYVPHSSRILWHQKRNVQVEGRSGHPNPGPPLDTLPFSYQDEHTSKVETFESREWKVLGEGKDGKLKSWMRETDRGIEDDGGEIRVDWRTRLILLYFPSTASTPAGIDILSSREKKLSDEILADIRTALQRSDGELRDFAAKITRVVMDGGRDQEQAEKRHIEREKWEKRSGPQEGISPDLYYDDEEETKGHSKCSTM